MYVRGRCCGVVSFLTSCDSNGLEPPCPWPGSSLGLALWPLISPTPHTHHRCILFYYWYSFYLYVYFLYLPKYSWPTPCPFIHVAERIAFPASPPLQPSRSAFMCRSGLFVVAKFGSFRDFDFQALSGEKFFGLSVLDFLANLKKTAFCVCKSPM